jgi:hypothetical protein
MSGFRRGQNLAHPSKKSVLALALTALLGLIIGLQIWLLTATLNTALGGDHSIVVPSLVASIVLFLVALAIFRLLPKPYTWRSVPDLRIEQQKVLISPRESEAKKRIISGSGGKS